MARSLVIVESPAKAGTLGKFLGKDFQVTACYGHVRDLDRKGISVDRAKDYKPNYRIVPGKEKTVDELARLAKKADTIYLAADPDREGEAICWHLHELLKKEAPDATFHRAEFNEITKSAVTRAIEKPGKISKDRVGAQQARRIIDRLVGYEVSELLWNKVWRGLSRRARPDGGAAHHRRARDRARGLRRDPLLLGARHAREGRGGRSRRASSPGAARSSSSTAPTRASPRTRRPRRCAPTSRASSLRVASVEARERRTEPGAALHDLEAAAGRGPLARLLGAPHDEDRAAALRGPRRSATAARSG